MPSSRLRPNVCSKNGLRISEVAPAPSRTIGPKVDGVGGFVVDANGERQ